MCASGAITRAGEAARPRPVSPARTDGAWPAAWGKPQRGF